MSVYVGLILAAYGIVVIICIIIVALCGIAIAKIMFKYKYKKSSRIVNNENYNDDVGYDSVYYSRMNYDEMDSNNKVIINQRIKQLKGNTWKY